MKKYNTKEEMIADYKSNGGVVLDDDMLNKLWNTGKVSNKIRKINTRGDYQEKKSSYFAVILFLYGVIIGLLYSFVNSFTM